MTASQEGQETAESATAKGAPKGRASFCIPSKAIDALVSNERVKASHISMYLCIASGTDKGGELSTWGRTSWRKYAGLTKDSLTNDRAKEVAEFLYKVVTKDGERILYPVEEWCDLHPEIAVKRKPPGEVKHVVPMFNEPEGERTWFDSGLISDNDKPLLRINGAQSRVAKDFLLLHQAVDMSRWGGVNPRVFYFEYREQSTTAPRKESYAARFVRWQRGRPVGSVSKESVYALIGAKLFYYARTMFSRADFLDEDSQQLADIDPMPKGTRVTEPMVGGLIRGTLKAMGEAAGKTGTTAYGVAMPGHELAVAGILRPRYRPANSKLAFATDWLAIKRSSQKEVARLLRDVVEPMPVNKQRNDLLSELNKYAPQRKKAGISEYEKHLIEQSEALEAETREDGDDFPF